jgi:hypothetical protein
MVNTLLQAGFTKEQAIDMLSGKYAIKKGVLK